jgi:PIN domain nuclease of toxin-antitoxin system
VTYLLDTHAFLWLALGLRPVPTALGAQLANPQNQLAVSAISAFEVATKVRLGKLDDASRLLPHWQQAVSGLAANDLPVSVEHGLLAGMLDWDHRDPFDRLLVAQAIHGGLTLVSADRALFDAPDVDLLRW